MNIRIAKAYRSVSNEALCIITGLTPTDIKREETVQYYQCTKGIKKMEELFDHDTRPKH
jgi:hypothetical protein